MAVYSSLKVTELKELLKKRELGVSGTKPELIARLEEFDASSESNVDEAGQAVSAPEPVVTSNTTADEAPKAEETETLVAEPEILEEPSATAQDDTLDSSAADLPSANDVEVVIEELEKRVSRTKKWGTPTETDELVKQIARIRKYGLSDAKGASRILSSVKRTNEAVPSKVMKKRRERFGKA